MNDLQKHTPGPWEACERGDYEDFDGNSNVILGDDRRIAVVQNNGSEEAEANAYLVAAAPDLLEALASLLRKVECGSALHCSLCDQARAAIAKAKGQVE